jgi:hypothetical protein
MVWLSISTNASAGCAPDSITKFLEFTINTVISQSWFESERIEEDVYIL